MLQHYYYEKDDEVSYLDIMLYNFIPQGSKVLFVKPKRYKGLPYLKKTKNVDISVLSNNSKMSDYITSIGAEFFLGDVTSLTLSMKKDSFDFVIMDDVIFSYPEINIILQYVFRISQYCLITIKNKSKLSDRLKFLFYGSVFNDEDGEDWYSSKDLYSCNLKEFSTFCFKNGFIIERASFYDKKMNLKSAYDLTKIPSLFADKFFLTIKKF